MEAQSAVLASRVYFKCFCVYDDKRICWFVDRELWSLTSVRFPQCER
jgi:hypothetical protein